MGKTQTAINFIPQGSYLVVTIPRNVIEPSTLEVPEKAKKSFLEEKLREYIESGAELIVVAIGNGCEFVKLEDRVLLASHARAQRIHLEEESDLYFVIREQELLGKLD